ncbi:DNA-directed RNA polymerase I subunit RPA12-like [Homarus americanus]|uniref:DNA-directed RNA polymerase subunit n=1 Tax=Homarus americanus TaxID=6706 RepID=A0A8J5TLP0_HOMAM|nr:DNA-directed RNA polymerase I subunit RPA12-like [Homarus americanus]
MLCLQMTEETLRQLFVVEPDFCPACGSILVLPQTSETVACRVCTFKTPIDDIINRETTYKVDFVQKGTYLVSKKKVEEESELGQMDNDRECSKCGNIGMSYTTMQLRSADEGQTVFYICPKCR